MTYEKAYRQARTNVEFTARCRAFNHRIEDNRILVSIPDHSVRVWDPIADHYTRCHDLSERTIQRLLRQGLAEAGESCW